MYNSYHKNLISTVYFTQGMTSMCYIIQYLWIFNTKINLAYMLQVKILLGSFAFKLV